MAADNELRLISRAIRTRDIAPILEYGLQDDWFYVDENRSVWKFIRQHFSKYSEVPTAVTVKDNFPTYRLLNVDDSIEYLLDQLVEYRRRQKAIEIVQDAADAISSGDHLIAIEAMSAGIAKIMDEGVGQSHDIDLSKDPMSRYDEYEAVKTRPNGLIGMATGFSLIDQATAGLQPGQLIVIIAPPKTGKSVVALQTAVNLHEDGFVPMFQSFEMSSREQQTRHDAMRANISHARLTRGALKTDEEARYAKSLKRMENMHNFFLTDGVSSATLSGLQAKIEKLQPDVVFVDGVYLMTDEVTGELGISFLALTNITRGLKRLAQKVQKPIVVTTQVLESKMKGGRVSASSIGYSSSFFQDADVILALERQDAEDDSSRLFRIEASRNCGKVEVELLWDWENGKFQEY
ncbi:DnaB Replicative DNA helicase [uncultured Caudovirales phage]|uniref:DnaB Replicative DNA helicase n=1 Tax=uncultured Caudovirales phage TaxID=2100421 RepID=A0A6J5N5D5_9CAUD|nr:DnaB Replicative DNA helicase [uncultured Caudovirales phage]